MRRSELLGLEWDNVNFDRRIACLPLTKNGDSRAVPLSTRAVAILQDLPRTVNRFVFAGLTGNALKLAYQRAVLRAGVEGLRFHDLRHEATSRFFEKGLNVMEVASITGHKTLQMLRRYTHVAGTYWISDADFDAEYHEQQASHIFRQSADTALSGLTLARDAYFAQFASLGIGGATMRNLIGAHRSISADAAFELSRAPF